MPTTNEPCEFCGLPMEIVTHVSGYDLCPDCVEDYASELGLTPEVDGSESDRETLEEVYA